MLRVVLFGVGYAVMGALGLALLLPAGGAYPTLFGALILLISVAGLAKIGFVPWFERHRPEPVVATAPSGAQSTFFRRSSFRMVSSLLFTAALALWCGVVAVASYRSGHGGWATVLAGFALFLLWPVAVAAAGRISPGGLWLTENGLEHRNGAVSWMVAWSDLRSVVTDEPVRLQLAPGARPVITRTVAWIWSYEVPGPEQQLGVGCTDLAGGPPLVVAVLAYYLGDPPQRERLGTAQSWARGPR